MLRRSALDLSCLCCTPRRGFLKGLAASAVAATAPTLPSLAQAPAKKLRIDVHHHFAPPGYDSVGAAARPAASGWTIQKDLDDMDRAGITTAIHSTAGAFLGNREQARKNARIANETAAKLVSDHRGRFGSFASIPMPDMEGCLAEIHYAMDVLKADGVYLWTSWGDKYLGDPAFAPVYEELNRRKAVTFVHPAGPACCRNLVPGLRPADIEYGTDTTRAIARMIFAGTARKYPDMRIIWSHAGGTMPFLIERFTNAAREDFKSELPNGFLPEAQKFFYDTAQATNKVPMTALKLTVPVSQIVFGTDFPYRRSVDHVEGLRSNGVFTEAELTAIDWQNVARLFPKYAA
jgi:predicted TIM-barrel fold metal-dependent hydrolase